MKAWRLSLAVIGLAALAGALVALALSGGFRGGEGTSRVSSSATASVTRRASATPTPRPTASAAATVTAVPSASGSPELSALVQPARDARRLTGTTLIVPVLRVPSDTTFVTVPVAAVPIASPSPRPSPSAAGGALTLGTLARNSGLQVRPDGTVVAVALATGSDTVRIATWDLRSGATEWVTADEAGVRNTTPVWSADGASVYYASARGTSDLGIWRIRADGSQRTLVRRPGPGAPVSLVGLTPDGSGLVWSAEQAGGTVNVFDLASGAERPFDDTTAATALAWREARPRALVAVGGGAGQPGARTLVLWDDVTGTKRTLLGPEIANSPDSVLAADFDPTGTRIVIVASSRIGELEGSALNLIDLSGKDRTVLAGSEGAQQVLWFRAGIVFTRRGVSGGTDILLISPSGGTPALLYSAPGEIGKLQFVSP